MADSKVQSMGNILQDALTLLSNPLLAATDVGRIAIVLNYGIVLFQQTTPTLDEFNQVETEIKALAVANRGPTDAEWAAWQTTIDGVTAQFQQVRVTVAVVKPNLLQRTITKVKSWF